MNEPTALPIQGPNTFSARARAAGIANDIMERYIAPIALGEATRDNPLGEAYIEIPSAQKRTFTLGHWSFKFNVVLQDERGSPPAVWYFLEIYHKDQPDCDQIPLAVFFDFNEFDCSLNIYRPEQSTDTTTIVTYNGLDYDELVQSAAGYIRQYLEADPPVITRCYYREVIGFKPRKDRDSTQLAGL